MLGDIALSKGLDQSGLRLAHLLCDGWVAAVIVTINPTLAGYTDYIWDTSLFALGVAVTLGLGGASCLGVSLLSMRYISRSKSWHTGLERNLRRP